MEQHIMEKNVGGIDRTARLVIGPALILVGIVGYAGLLSLAVGPLPQALTALIVILVGAVLLVTGITQKCPLNRLVGLNTFRKEDSAVSKEGTGINK